MYSTIQKHKKKVKTFYYFTRKLDYMKKKIIFLLSFFAFASTYAKIKIATWNLQTFFDSEIDGTEYKEFLDGKSNWGETLYKQRVDKTNAIIKEINADVIVLEELEKETELYDLSYNYKYAAFAKEEGASIGIGVLSKREITDVQWHSTFTQKRGKKSSPTRPILSFCVKDGNNTITIFANHWKSKLGGGEVQRLLQESTLSFFASRAAKNSRGVVALGDFNMDNSEFNLVGKYTALRSFFGDDFLCRSVWNDNEIEGGSYGYRDEWERIDNILYSGDVSLSDFTVLAKEPLLDEKGFPARFILYKRTGYSDHLPLSVHAIF